MSEAREISLKDLKAEILKCLNEINISVSKIILFGSRAIGNFLEDSDLDILIIIDNELSLKEKREVGYLVYRTLHGNHSLSSFDIIIKSASSFWEEKEIVNTISNEAYLEGVEL